jgi:hypothetical protein
MRKDWERASELYAEVEVLCRELDDHESLRVTLGNRSFVALNVGDLELAIALASEARDRSHKHGDASSTVTACMNLSHAASLAGDRRLARDALIQAIEVARDLGHVPVIALGLVDAAHLVAEHEPAAAAIILAAARRVAVELEVELGPDWRESAAATERQIGEALKDEGTEAATAGELAAVLDTAAVLALESLALTAT